MLPFRKSYPVLLGFSEGRLYLVISLCYIHLGFPKVVISAVSLQFLPNHSNICVRVCLLKLCLWIKVKDSLDKQTWVFRLELDLFYFLFLLKLS